MAKMSTRDCNPMAVNSMVVTYSAELKLIRWPVLNDASGTFQRHSSGTSPVNSTFGRFVLSEFVAIHNQKELTLTASCIFDARFTWVWNNKESWVSKQCKILKIIIDNAETARIVDTTNPSKSLPKNWAQKLGVQGGGGLGGAGVWRALAVTSLVY